MQEDGDFNSFLALHIALSFGGCWGRRMMMTRVMEMGMEIEMEKLEGEAREGEVRVPPDGDWNLHLTSIFISPC